MHYSEHQSLPRQLLLSALPFESKNGILIIDMQGNIVLANRAFTRTTGYHADEVRGQPVSILNSGRHTHEFFHAMREELQEHGHWEGEIWNRYKNGRVSAEWLSIFTAAVPGLDQPYFVATFSNILHAPEASAEIHRLAYYDTITGLPNRRLLLDNLEQALINSAHSKRHGALIVLDLDHFKNINDARGYEAGESLLHQAAVRLAACVRDNDTPFRMGDTVARLGGDEFALLLEELATDAAQALNQARHVVDKIHQAMRCAFLVQGEQVVCTASIGFSLFEGERDSVDGLMRQADIAMYHAKQAGRDSVKSYQPDMLNSLVAYSALEHDLRFAISDDQFELYFQTQVDRCQRITGAEVLLRWHHPVRGILYPDEFIQLAEEAGLIIPLGRWVLHQTCEVLQQWSQHAQLHALELSVNVSALQFHQHDLVEELEQWLGDSQLNPDRLKIELTESLVLTDVAGTIKQMNRLKASGVKFSMDDFGTGYSSLAYLRQLPLDQLKIDQSFVKGLSRNQEDIAIIKAIIMMGEAFSLEVIAEGVETREQQHLLAQHGCFSYQGYLFGRPLTQQQFEQQAVCQQQANG